MAVNIYLLANDKLIWHFFPVICLFHAYQFYAHGRHAELSSLNYIYYVLFFLLQPFPLLIPHSMGYSWWNNDKMQIKALQQLP